MSPVNYNNYNHVYKSLDSIAPNAFTPNILTTSHFKTLLDNIFLI